MTEMLDTRLKRPVASDMSMDEILSSIRKIISAEETQYNNNVSIHAPVVAPVIPLLKQDPPKLKVPLSAREQLKSLTEELYGFGDQEGKEFHLSSHQFKNIPVFTDTKIETPRYEPFFETSLKERPPEFPQPIKQNPPQDTADILQTLENIRQSLTQENLRKASSEEDYLQKTPSQDVTPIIKSPHEMYSDVPISEIKNAKLNQEVALKNIDLKPAQLKQDDIPAFLKKFKQEQDAIIKSVTADTSVSVAQMERSVPDYDFSKVAAFDEDDSVMELTEALLPDNVQKISNNLLETATQSMVSSSGKTKNLASPQSGEGDDAEDDGVADALEMLMIKSLRPMLKEWIADNMQNLAEKILREELHKRSSKKS